MKLKIDITKEVIDKSNELLQQGSSSGTPRSCAIAVALKPKFPNVWVGRTILWLNTEEPPISYFALLNDPCVIELEPNITAFIDGFDRASANERVCFAGAHLEIEVPDNAEELCNPQK